MEPLSLTSCLPFYSPYVKQGKDIPKEDPLDKKPEETLYSDRMSLSQVVLGEKTLHDAVESSPFVVRLRNNEATKQEYMQYLANVQYDLEVLEVYLAAHAESPLLKEIDIYPLFRLQALKRDITGLGVPVCGPSTLVKKHDHQRHFAELHKNKPYLLVAHAAMRYLALLFGGQYRAERLKKLWGEKAPIQFYQFKKDVKEIITNFLSQLDAFGSKLTDVQYREFRQELLIAWQFAGDILDHDIRNLRPKF